MTKQTETASAPGTPGAAKASSSGVGQTPTTATGATGQSASTTTQQTSQQPKVTPKDAQVISTILKDMGVHDFEPRVVHQLLEFAYRYVTNILEDAQVFSTYSKKKSIDSEDVRLAVQMQVDKMFTSPPPREVIAEIARQKNSVTLPPIKSHAGPRLPPDRYSLISCNFKMKSGSPPITPSSQVLSFKQGSSLIGMRGSPIIGLTNRNPSLVALGNRLTTGNELNTTGVKRKLDS